MQKIPVSLALAFSFSVALSACWFIASWKYEPITMQPLAAVDPGCPSNGAGALCMRGIKMALRTNPVPAEVDEPYRVQTNIVPVREVLQHHGRLTTQHKLGDLLARMNDRSDPHR